MSGQPVQLINVNASSSGGSALLREAEALLADRASGGDGMPKLLPRVRRKRTPSPVLPPPVVASTKLQRQLHYFAQLVSPQETLIDNWVGLEEGDEETYDQVLKSRFLHSNYNIARALFWLQNQDCLGNLRLFHIVQSRGLTLKFVELVDLTRVRPRTAFQLVQEAKKRAELRAWFLAQTTWEPDQPDPEFEVPTESPYAEPKPDPMWSALMQAVGVEACKTLTDNELTLLLESTLYQIKPDLLKPERLVAKQHPLVQLTTLMAYNWLDKVSPATTKAEAQHRELERTNILRWLRNYLLHGCRCAA